MDEIQFKMKHLHLSVYMTVIIAIGDDININLLLKPEEHFSSPS